MIAEPETGDGTEEEARGEVEEAIAEPETGEDLGVEAEEPDSRSAAPEALGIEALGPEALGPEALGIEALIDEGPTFPEPPAEVSASEQAEAGPAEASAEEPPGLSAEDIDRIARRMIEIAGDGVLREIAWEVVPDLAEVIVREPCLGHGKSYVDYYGPGITGSRYHH